MKDRKQNHEDTCLTTEEYRELQKGFGKSVRHTVTVEFAKKHYFIYGLTGTIILTLIFLIISQISNRNTELKAMYNFQSSMREEMIPYEKRKEIFITKATYIMKSSKYGKLCTFTDQEKFNLAAKVFDLWQETHISGYLFLAMVYEESGFNNIRKGDAGEITYAQFMPTTWKEVTSGSDFFGSDKDIYYVAAMWFRLMQNNMNYFNDTKRAILAYNCGTSFAKYFKTNSEVEKYKDYIYRSKGRKPYDERVIEKYNEFINLDTNI
jgi:hypothetical protein